MLYLICTFVLLPLPILVMFSRASLKSLGQIQDLLNPAYYKPSALKRELLRSRAIPNARLIRAFQLKNTFVSPDPEVHSTFTQQAHQLIHQAAFGRPLTTLIQDTLEGVLRWALPNNTDSIIENSFESILQVFVFKSTICQLFQLDPSNLPPCDVIAVTSGINRLWQLSKQPNSLDASTECAITLQRINEHLRLWLPHIPNALNFIIPAYETMWRVVAVGVARYHRDQVDTLTAFFDIPTREQFGRNWSQQVGPNVKALINEVLRLHPPTKRISRALPLFPFCNRLPLWVPDFMTRIVTADIEALHRDTNIWGPDANVFNPGRYDSMTARQERSLMPFGDGPLRCIAYNWAPFVAGLLVAAVVKEIDSDPCLSIVEGESIGDRDGWDGWKIVRSPL